MAKRKAEKIGIANEEQETQIAVIEAPTPEPRRFTPKDCAMCETHRPRGVSYSRVYSTQGRIRYCKCGFCGHTWSQEGA